MKCPKCHYVSFEPEPRCRHCGYGFSLADAEPTAALSEPEVPGADMPADGVPAPRASAPVAAAANPPATSPRLVASSSPAPGPAAVPPSVPPPASTFASVKPASPPRPRARPASRAAVDELRPFASAVADWEPELIRTAPAATSELPLFVQRVVPPAGSEMADEPLVRVPKDPRPPLAVRRPVPVSDAPPAAHAAAVPARPVSRRLGPLDRDLLEDLERIERAERDEARERTPSPRAPGMEGSVGGGLRLAAAALDAIIIGGLGVLVLWVTLRWCELPIEQISTLPAVPMLAFQMLVLLGYLLVFTAAGGQTIGKMAFGLRIVGDSADQPVPGGLTLSQAGYRVLLSLPSVCALGLGLLPALLGRDQAIHDRLAHTRVVRA